MTRTLGLTLIVLLLAQGVAAQEPSREENLVVTFRARPDVRPETLRELANLLEEVKIEVPRTMQLRDFLREEYGSSIEPIRKLFASENGKLEYVKEGTTITLPAAPEWRVNVQADVPDDTKVTQLAELWMGYSGKKTVEDIGEWNKLPVARVKEQRGGTIVLPYISPYVSYRVRSEYAGRAEFVRARLRALMAKDDALFAEATGEYTLTPHFGALAGGAGTCPVGAPAGASLCGFDRVKQYPATQPTIVAVVDSGIPTNDTRFRFWENAKEKNGTFGQDDSDDLQVDDLIGVNFAARGGFPKDDVAVEPWTHHGTHVTGIASCRWATAAHLPDLDARLHVMILKVARSDAKVDPFAISEAVRYARLHGAHVVNLSLEGPRSITVRDTIADTKDRVLFVAAAGNGANDIGRNLDKTDLVYPAAFSTTLPNVISVAAHDAEMKIACFSNYGGKTVDIAAPGTDIESTVAGKMGKKSGTSQATPFVTLAAALLHARGLDNPARIRRRIMDSADFHPSLAGQVRSDGALNIEKALAYDEDLIRLADQTVLYGAFETPPGMITVPKLGRDVPFASIRRIVVGYAPGLTKLYLEGEGLPADIVDAVTLPTFVLKVNGATRSVEPKDMLEVIPRLE